MQIQRGCHIGDQAGKHLSWEVGMLSTRAMDICKWIQILHHMCNKESKWTLTTRQERQWAYSFAGTLKRPNTLYRKKKKDIWEASWIQRMCQKIIKIAIKRSLPPRGDSTKTRLYDNHRKQDPRESNRALIHKMVILIERIISRQWCYKKMQYGIGRRQQ